jgi:ethanolamine utilization protein EutN
MYLGRVVGCVWSTVKHPGLSGHRLLLVQPITPQGGDSGRRVVCTDWTGAGAGDTVYWCRGREASYAFLPEEVPSDHSIVGIVDTIHTPKQEPPC